MLGILSIKKINPKNIKKYLPVNSNKKKDNENNYKKIIKNKDTELNYLKNQLKVQLNNSNKQDKVYLNEMMCVNFVSSDQKIHYAVPCISNNTFAEVEEKLYQEFPEYRETNNNFLANGQPVLRFKTISQNKIGKGLPVTLVVV
jgi:phosphate starvation-inducible protein PhoH